MLSGKFPTTFLAACIILSGCDSARNSGHTTGQTASSASGLEFQLPEKIRTSLAVDFSQVEGIANVNGRVHQMQRVDDSFRATVPNIPINREVSIDLLFSETLPDGNVVDLARTEPQTFSIGNTDRTIEISEEQFVYDIDDDGDGLSNIAERNGGTDPTVPEIAGTRTITVEFNLPQRIIDTDITRIANALIANRSRDVIRQNNFVSVTNQVPNNSTIDIDIRLDQLFGGFPILIAQALTEVDAGVQNVTVLLQDDDFNFEFDNDRDGISNIDEIQSGRDPFLAE